MALLRYKRYDSSFTECWLNDLCYVETGTVRLKPDENEVCFWLIRRPRLSSERSSFLSKPSSKSSNVCMSRFSSMLTCSRRPFSIKLIDYRPLATDMPSGGHEVTSQPTRRGGGANVSLMDSQRQVTQLAANRKARWLRAEDLLVRNCPSAWIATGGRRVNARRG